MTEPATTPTAPSTANLDATLRDFRLNAYYRNATRDRSSFTSSNERSALWFYQRPDGRVFLIQSQAPFVINQIQRAFGVNPVDGRFGPQTLAAVRADALRNGVTFPNQLTPQVMAYALRKAFHRSVGTVALPARFELPNIDAPNLATSRSTFLGALDVATGQAATIDPGTGTVGQNLPAPPPATSTSTSNTTNTTLVNINPSLTATLGTPTETTRPPGATPSVPNAPSPTASTGTGYMGASMIGSGVPAELRALFGQSSCPPCNTEGPNGQCKPQDPADCTPPSALRRAAPFIGAGIFVVSGLAAIGAAGVSARRQGYGPKE